MYALPLNDVIVRVLKRTIGSFKCNYIGFEKRGVSLQSVLQTVFTFSNALTLLEPAGQLTSCFFLREREKARERETPRCHSALTECSFQLLHFPIFVCPLLHSSVLTSVMNPFVPKIQPVLRNSGMMNM